VSDPTTKSTASADFSTNDLYSLIGCSSWPITGMLSATTAESPRTVPRAAGTNCVPGKFPIATPGDLGSLMAYLEAQGIATEDRAELETALSPDKGQLGPRVKAWLGEMAMKAASSGGRVFEGATGGVIASAVARFLNLA
jgi:hypothetical protein